MPSDAAPLRLSYDESIDLTCELRLRRWARQNHVPPAARLESWHAVIMDEMTQCDREQAEVVIPATLTLKPLSRRQILRRSA